MRNFTKNELDTMIKNHSHWILEDCCGWQNMKADLGGANLRGADLGGANLRGADLGGADLGGANLSSAHLSYANLRGADLHSADLSGANLHSANFRGADLSCANLRGANLRGANLHGADLSCADLDGADLDGADLDGADLRSATNVPFIPMTCPEEGSFIGWKKCGSGRIVKLEIQADARRSSSTSRKCRCSKAKVLSIESVSGDITFDNAISKYDPNFIYHVGEIVSVDDFCENRFEECATGIHFFINRQEAVNYM